jgi:hypothetical protein
VSDGHTEDLARRQAAGEWRVDRFRSELNLAAREFEPPVADQGAGQEAALDEDLESVADAQDQAAFSGKSPDRPHNGGKLGNGSAAQIIAVGKPPREDNGIYITKIVGVVPDEVRLLAEVPIHGEPRIVIAIAAGKNNNAKFHGQISDCVGRHFQFTR